MPMAHFSYIEKIIFIENDKSRKLYHHLRNGVKSSHITRAIPAATSVKRGPGAGCLAPAGKSRCPMA